MVLDGCWVMLRISVMLCIVDEETVVEPRMLLLAVGLVILAPASACLHDSTLERWVFGVLFETFWLYFQDQFVL